MDILSIKELGPLQGNGNHHLTYLIPFVEKDREAENKRNNEPSDDKAQYKGSMDKGV
jgi:hypothetical protein